MSDTHTSNTAPGWFWQDYVSTYRFWGLVLASFLMTCSASASSMLLFSYFNTLGMDVSSITPIFGVGMIGTYTGALVVLYFLRHRLKAALIIFALVTAIANLLIFSGKITAIPALTFLSIFARLGESGFIMTTIVALVGGRPNLQSFIMVYTVITIWTMAARVLAPATMAIALSKEIFWIAGIPALLAILALAPMAGKMFAEKPETNVDAKVGPTRQPFLVFLLSAFIPFYFLVWIFKRPAELKALAPHIHQPSRGGALTTTLLAPFLLPIWFHNVRDELDEKLPGRSANLMGVVSFFFPVIAAAMAQSDNNIVSKNL